MRFRSIKSILKLFAVIIIALSAFSATTIYLSRMLNKADEKYHQILQLEIDFLETILIEDNMIKHLDRFPRLKGRYEKLQEKARKLGFGNETSMMSVRAALSQNLFDMHQNLARQLKEVRRLLPNLIDSVRYIHEHHIAYLKNLLRRGHVTQDWDVSDEFKRSAVISAPELEIIRSAVAVQNRLLDIFTIFYKMQIGDPPSTLSDEFRRRIKDFYSTVNKFEDYSLDAQDGLLVEELLINGRKFEDAFSNLLEGESLIKLLSHQLAQNRDDLFDRLNSKRREINQKNNRFSKNVIRIQYVSALSFVLMIVLLLIYSRRMVKAFHRTVGETEKIEDNLTYAIDIKDSDYEEFGVVFRALNAMARTIEKQMDDLKNAQSQLSERVKDRTQELEIANRQLKKEIEDRIKAEDERIELEQRLNRVKKMEAIGTLAGGVAHDLNNVLSGIVSYPQLLLMDLPKDSPFRESILAIQESGFKAAAIVQDLLTLARRGVTVSEIINLNGLVLTYLNSPECEKLKYFNPEVQITTSLDENLLNIAGSPIHLTKTIMNLMSNAAEAMPDGGEVVVRTENIYVDKPIKGYDRVNEGDYVVLSVSDTGIGIDPDDLERIFDPFFTKKVMGHSGTGLGMAVVWGTVKDHHGYIDVESSVEHGTIFRLYFPVTREELTGGKQEISIDHYMGRGESILVVDDIEAQRVIATKILRKLGYTVTSVSSGEEAIEYVAHHSQDLLVLDMIMEPGIDGLETYRQIKKTHPEQKAIIASGFSETGRVKKALQLGAGEYVKKPYTIEKMGMAVRRELDK
jgi:signal transduction histidine kinase